MCINLDDAPWRSDVPVFEPTLDLRQYSAAVQVEDVLDVVEDCRQRVTGDDEAVLHFVQDANV